MNDEKYKVNCPTDAEIACEAWHVNQNSRIHKDEQLSPMEPAKNVQGGVRLGLGSTDNLRILTGLDLPIDIGIAQLKLLSRIHLLCLCLILFPFL